MAGGGTRPAYSLILRGLLLCSFVALMCIGGCKFREPDPSPDIYLNAVSPVQPTKQAANTSRIGREVPRSLLALIAKAAPVAGGYQVRSKKSALYFQPPADMVRAAYGEGLRTYINGTCSVAVSKVLVPCEPSNLELVRAELMAAKVLSGKRLEAYAKRMNGNYIVFQEGDGPEILVSVNDYGVAEIRYNEQVLLKDILTAGKPAPLDRNEWATLLETPESGESELVRTAQLEAVCVPHRGGVNAIGPSVRRARDLATTESLSVLTAAGVLLRRDAGQMYVCLAVTTSGPSTTALESHDVWRTWNRGGYEALPTRKRQGLMAAQQMGHELSDDCAITLYQDPSTTPEQDLVSHVDCRVFAQRPH